MYEVAKDDENKKDKNNPDFQRLFTPVRLEHPSVDSKEFVLGT